jgi:hypothetical protein
VTLYLVAMPIIFSAAVAMAADPAAATPSKLADFWHTAVHYFNVVAPWLVVAGIPSLIVALNKYPKATGFVGALHVLLDFLSALTPKDSPGTMKLPFRRSQPPVGVLAPPSPPMPSKAALIFVPLLFFTLASCVSSYCSQAIHKDEAQCKAQQVAVTIGKACGEPALLKIVEQIGPQVVLALLSMDFSNLLANIVATLKQQGVTDALTAVTCAVQTVAANGTAPPGTAADKQPALVSKEQTNARAWLKTQPAVL